MDNEDLKPAKVFTLPDDTFPFEATLDSIIIHHFISTTERVRERTFLNRNAISLVISGQKTMHFAEKTVHPNDSEIHFLSSGNCIASMDISKYRDFESILIFFDDKELADFYIANAAFSDKMMKRYKPSSSPYVSFVKDAFISNYIQSLRLMIIDQKQVSRQMKRLKLHELLLYLLENHAETFLAFRNTERISRSELTIRKVVESNIMSNLTLDEMAFLCNLSLSTFKRKFKKIYSISPTAWFLERKMSMALNMLTMRKEKPGEIWFKLGFESHSGFTKSFKKRFGVSPKEYTSRLTFKEQTLNSQV